MKFFIYLIIIISIIAFAGLFVFKQPNGQTWLSFKGGLPNTEIINEKINLITNQLHRILESDIPEKDSTIKVYRWKDSNDNWNYSDKSKSSIESEEVLFDQNNIVVLPAFDVTTIDSSNSKESHDNTASKDLITKPNKILKLYNDVNNVQKLMDSRSQKISKNIEDSKG